MSARPAKIQRIVDDRHPASARHQLAALSRAARRHPRGDRPGAQGMNAAHAEPRRWERFFWPLLRHRAPPRALALLPSRWTGTKVFPSPLEVERGLARARPQGRPLAVHRRLAAPRRHRLRRRRARSASRPASSSAGIPPPTRSSIPPIQILRPISPLAWIPVAIVLFGVGDLAPIFLIFLGVVLSRSSSPR